MPGRVLGAVDETEQVTLVEVLEAVHLVDDLGDRAEPVDDQRRQLEAQVEAGRPDMKEQVAGRGDGRVPGADDLAKRVQPGRARPSEEPIPQLRADAGDAGETGLGVAEADRAIEPGDVGQQVAHDLLAAAADVDDHEDGRRRELGQDRLGLDRLGHPISLADSDARRRGQPSWLTTSVMTRANVSGRVRSSRAPERSSRRGRCCHWPTVSTTAATEPPMARCR